MTVFWITFNLADLQCPLIICLADIELELLSKFQSAFRRKISTLNLIAVVKFFHIIYDAIFMSLFGIGQTIGGLFRPMINYFATIETNSCRILHLNRLMWLTGISYLTTLQSQIQSNVQFCQKLLLFLEHIIKYSAFENLHTQTLDQISPVANDPITMS